MEERRPEHPGQQIVRWLRPGGCILVLAVSLLVMITFLLSGREPIKGYAPPRDDAYWAQHLDELKAELEQNVFPVIGGVGGCEVTGDTLTVTFTGADYAVPRAAILRYFDSALFTFVKP